MRQSTEASQRDAIAFLCVTLLPVGGPLGSAGGEVADHGEDPTVVILAGSEAELVVDVRGVLDHGLLADT